MSLPPPGALGHASPMKRKGNAKTKMRSGKHEKDEAHQNHHAESLVQQTWVQAVRVGGIVIVLHSGNYELVCLRHRGSQTLYVSDLIEPPTCTNLGYGKVSHYVAAIQDTIDRHKQLLHGTSEIIPCIGVDNDKDH